MNIVVCVKPVCDVSIISLGPDASYIDSDDLVYIVNPYDVVAVEEAVRMKERNGNSQVTIVSLAPPSTKRLLYHCLAMGADESILIWDSAFDTLDSYAKGVILAKAISSFQYDLVLCGHKAIDTESGQVGSIIADRLDIPLVTTVVEMEFAPSGREITVESKLEKGYRARVAVVPPALLTVDIELNEPRYPSLPSLMTSLRKNIEEYNLRALGLSYEEIELKTKVVAISQPKPRPKKLFTPDSKLSAAERMRIVMSGGATEKKGDIFEGSPEELSAKFVEFMRQVGI